MLDVKTPAVFFWESDNEEPSLEHTCALASFLRSCGVLNGGNEDVPASYAVEAVGGGDYAQHILTRSSAAVELVFFALDNASGTIAYVCRGREEDVEDEFFEAAARLVSTKAGYQLVAVIDPGDHLPERVRSICAVVCEWQELSGLRYDRSSPDLSTVLHQLQCLRPWCTPTDLEPIWLASKPAVLVSDLCAHAERFGYSFDLAAAEAAGTIFRGGTPPYEEWVMLASTAFEAPRVVARNFAAVPQLVPPRRAFGSRSASSPLLSAQASPLLMPAAVVGESLESRQFRQLAADLRDWLVAKPPPREIVLSRSGLVPFLTSEPITRTYACNPPTAAHVRHAVEAFGAANHLKCSSSPSRNNGATIVRLALPHNHRLRRLGVAAPAAAVYVAAAADSPVEVVAEPVLLPPPLRHLSSSVASEDDASDVFARDKRLVEDLYTWLCHRGRAEVSCADLMPFYSAYPAYRKGGGQGSGIKHAITRFGQNRLLWLERKSGGDARIVRLDVPRAVRENNNNDDDDDDARLSNSSGSNNIDEIETVVSSNNFLDDLATSEPPSFSAMTRRPSGGALSQLQHHPNSNHIHHQVIHHHQPPPVVRVPLSRRLQNAQKRVHVVVHDHEVVSGKPLPLKNLASAFKAMHGTEIDPPESLGFRSLAEFLGAAPRLCCCAVDDEQAVRCEPPPPEMAFVSDLRAHISAFAADRPEGVTFAQLKERVKLFGQERHTSVRFLRGGILGVINCVLVPSIVIQLEPNGLFYPANGANAIDHHFPPLPSVAVPTTTALDEPSAPSAAPIDADRLSSMISIAPAGPATTAEGQPIYGSLVATNAAPTLVIDSMPNAHNIFGGLDANLLSGVLASALDASDNASAFKWPPSDLAHTVTPENSFYERQLSA
ncbi:hypothetical protein CTAYLR_002949 [Chrysophaeum taylorii]|uniref:Uncharacterized protein n=1 Tax=Chrysophaeum taylorii TaxID=2483200 RepID=A0AAD7UNM5_9STRA|nr:hypothetical protein CTAYLR_002949 [Chrysophaeum taylorii]